MVQIFWPTLISNEELWRRTKQRKVGEEIKMRKFRWLGHTLRKSNEDITKQSLQWNPQGQRRRGRPKMTWRRQLNKEVRQLNLTYQTAERLTQDRSGLRFLVAGLSS